MISFVILNYNSYTLTLECIAKIKKLKTNKKVTIIVVDNHTLKPDEKQKLVEITDKVIVNEKNLGFAKGNNIGINYAKKNYNPEFVCVLNSDCFIEQTNFITQIYQIYKNDQFDMLGPKIKSDNYLSWNPFPVYDNLNQIKDKIKYYKKLLIFYNNRFLYCLLKIYLKIKNNQITSDQNGKKYQRNVALHGCCIIFSKKYLSKYTDAFYADTFLYHEEEFLYYRLRKDNLLSIYSPDLIVEHLEGQATNNSYTNERKKLLFKTQEILNSLYKLQKVIENNISI